MMLLDVHPRTVKAMFTQKFTGTSIAAKSLKLDLGFVVDPDRAVPPPWK